MVPLKTSPLSSVLLLTFLTSALPPLSSAAEEVETAAETVQMDSVSVETTRDKAFLLTLPKEAWDWRYGEMGDWEVLTSSTDTGTENLLKSLAEFTTLLNWMIPQWKLPPDRSLRLVICGPRHTFDELRPTASEGNQRDAITAYYPSDSAAVIVVNADLSTINVMETHGLAREGGFAELGADYGASEEDTGSSELAMESEDLPVRTAEFLKRDYVRHLLTSQGWTSPAWFTEGLVQLVATAKIENGRARIGKLDGVRIVTKSGNVTTGSGFTSDLSLFFQGRGMLPLIELFEIGYDSPEYLNPIGSTFSGQAFGFVHFCLYGDQGRQQANFLNWISQLQTQPPSEELFTACFGMSSKKMNIRLRGYFGSGRYSSPVTDAEELPAPPTLQLGPADPAQVAAIKAEVHRLAGRLPEARELLETALSRGFANAEVYDTLALLDLDAGRYDAAAQSLAKATALESTSENHRIALLHLDIMRSPVLDKASAKRLLTDTLQIHRQAPTRHRETTLLLAEVFLRSALKPDEAFLNLLDKSAARYRNDANLQDAVTRLHAKAAALQP